MTKWLAMLVAALSLSLPLAACGGDDDDDGGGGGATTQEQTEPAADSGDGSGGGGKDVKVSMKDIEFVPKDVTVAKGGKIEWTNDDEVPHTVTKESGPGAQFDSGSVSAGGTFSQTFDAPGKIDYVCEIHPAQTGTITVE